MCEPLPITIIAAASRYLGRTSYFSSAKRTRVLGIDVLQETAQTERMIACSSDITSTRNG
tara:strand:- start:276 stop:455 length:180 start_codon:yes stop_codon:yes gene_type:complete